MKKFIFLVFLYSANATSFAQKRMAADVLPLMNQVANWQLNEWQTKGMKWQKWDWTNAVCYAGLFALNTVGNDKKYIETLYKIGADNQWKNGPNRSYADEYCVGQMYCQLYQLYKEEAMLTDLKNLADRLIEVPHTESLEWKNKIFIREWAWCDALFMGPPSLAFLSTATGNKKYLDFANQQWWRTTNYLFDSTENLYFRDSRFFPKTDSAQKIFWSRGNGWVLSAVTRMIDNLPDDYADKKRYIELYKKMAKKIASLQHADGSWHSSLLDTLTYQQVETSGTAFFCYSLAWGINKGYLDYAAYFPNVKKSWEALEKAVHPDGKLGFVQQIGDKPGHVNFDDTEVYGVGAFLLAGAEIIKLDLHEQKDENILLLYNNTGVYRNDEVIEIDFKKLENKIPFIQSSFKIINAITKEELPYQKEYKGNKTPVHLLVQASMAPGAFVYLQFLNEPASSFTKKTYARYVPERYDDFAWENDVIAFRIYGMALEKTKENAYGIDVWSKRTPKLVIDNWYKKGTYHLDEGEGLDCYHVGFSLGDGNVAPYLHDSIYFSKNYRRFKMIDTGVLRTSFQLEYDDRKIEKNMYRETKTISIDAGSQFNRIEVNYFMDKKKPLPVAVGLVKRAGEGSTYFDANKGILAYWEPTTDAGTMGTATVLTQQTNQIKTTASHYLSIAQIKPGIPLVYYAGAVWDKAASITSKEEWFLYVKNFLLLKKMPVEIKW